MARPSVGRAVHVVPTRQFDGEPAAQHWAATVSEVKPEGLTLFVMHPAVPGSFLTGVQEDQGGKKPSTWHWPEREE